MNLSINILGIIFIFGAIQGFLLAIVLFTKYRKQSANIILGWLILLYSAFVVQALLFGFPKISANYPHLLLLFDGLPFLFGPLHLMYVGKLTDTRFKFAQPHWLHFVPFIIFKLYYIRIFFMSRQELYEVIRQVENNFPPLHISIFGALVAIQGLVYVIVALFVFREYAKKIRLTFSSLEKVNLSWLRYFTILALIVWLVVFVDNMLTISGVSTREMWALVPLLTSIFVYATGYIGLLKTEIFLQYDIYENIHEVRNLIMDAQASAPAGDGDTKYQKSGLTAEKADEYLEQLKFLMEKEHLYADPDLTLKDISERLGTSTHNISEIVNSRLNQNFFDFINRYRVEKVKEYLLDKDKAHLTLLGIALEAGFKSKSGFNAIFKRYTDKTPSEYRNALKALPGPERKDIRI